MRFGREFLWATALAATGLGCVGSSYVDSESLVGSSSEPIINGTTASSYPEAALVDMNGYACSGALIAPRVVLTAGHCVQGMTTWTVTLPFAGNQKARAAGATVYDYDDRSDYVNPNQHDIGLVFLGTDLTLPSWPVIPQTPLADGSKAIDIGRIRNGRLSNSALFQSQPVALKDATSEGFPYDYTSTEVIESGDSGGPVVDAGSSPHAIVAVNSGGGSGTQVLARTDLLHGWIDEQVRQHGGWGTGSGASSSGASSSGAVSSSGGGAIDGAALYASRCAHCHGDLASSDILFKTAAQILARHGTRAVSAEEAAAIATALASGASSGGSSSSGGGSSGAGSSSGGVSSSGGRSACTPEAEPNDSFKTASPLGAAACGALTTADVFDWYTWSIDGARPYAVDLRAGGDARVLMWKLVDGVYYLVENTTDTSIAHTATGPGTYYVLVLSFSATAQRYTLTLSGGQAPPGGSSSGGSSSGGATDGVTLYGKMCASCHRPLATSTKRGATAAQIVGVHGRWVTQQQADAIAAALSGGSSSGGGSSGGSSSGASSSGGGSSSGAGSSSGGSSGGGLDGARLYGERCAGCHRALATSTKRGRSGAQIYREHPDLVSRAEADAIAAALK